MKKLTKKMITGALAISLLGTSSGAFATSYYTVQSGDTFWKIADKNHVSILDLMEANDANQGTVLDIGQKLIIPDKVEDTDHYYEVQAGDTPWIISDKFGVNLQDLLAVNSLGASDQIYVGQRLVIPSQTEEVATYYEVQAGDTPWIISDKLDVNLQDLLVVNNLGETDAIYIGQRLVVSSKSEVNENYYEVQGGDTPWMISNKLGVNLQDLMAVNNLSEIDQIYVGQKLVIPSETEEVVTYYEVQAGDTPWVISNKLDVSLWDLLSINNLNEADNIYIGQKLVVPSVEYTTTEPKESTKTIIPEQSNTYITYKTHVIQRGDNLWTLGVEYGVGFNELLKVNNATESTYYNVGDEVKIPVHVVPEMVTLGSKFGEYLDWWQGAQYVVPIGSELTIIDFYTGQSFKVERTIGANHADVETLTAEDTQKLKNIFGGLSWAKRPVIVEYQGRRLAASLAAMPHAGNDQVKGGVEATWRSGDYGPGINLDYVKGNDMDGVIDLHFYNSTRHKDGQTDEKHQINVKIAAGIIQK